MSTDPTAEPQRPYIADLMLLRPPRTGRPLSIDLSRMTGLSPGHVSRCIRGERPASPELRRAAERLLGVAASTLWPAADVAPAADSFTDVQDVGPADE